MNNKIFDVVYIIILTESRIESHAKTEVAKKIRSQK